ncbi:hypothetical protein TNCV_2696831 [Trichonephila clavipes]|nr:hypothetical protein TNCV_2696831 [Trichonephila clavipes]
MAAAGIPIEEPPFFSRDLTVNELEAEIGDSCLNKSPGPDGIHGQMIDHLGLSGRSFSFFQGVPQGSVLSPPLFSLYLSGIESVIKRKCEVSAFADDIVLWKSDSD